MNHTLRYTVITERLPEEVSDLVMSALMRKLDALYAKQFDVNPDSITIRAYAVLQLGTTHAQVIHIDARFDANLEHTLDINSDVFNTLSARHLLSYRGHLVMHAVSNIQKGSD